MANGTLSPIQPTLVDPSRTSTSAPLVTRAGTKARTCLTFSAACIILRARRGCATSTLRVPGSRNTSADGTGCILRATLRSSSITSLASRRCPFVGALTASKTQAGTVTRMPRYLSAQLASRKRSAAHISAPAYHYKSRHSRPQITARFTRRACVDCTHRRASKSL